MSRLLRSRCPPLLGLRTGVARVAAPLTTIWSRIMWCLLRPSYRTMLFDSDVAIGGMAGFFRRLLPSLYEKNYSESFRDIPRYSIVFLVHCLIQTWPWKPAIYNSVEQCWSKSHSPVRQLPVGFGLADSLGSRHLHLERTRKVFAAAGYICIGDGSKLMIPDTVTIGYLLIIHTYL